MENLNNIRKDNKGLTLVELLVTLAVGAVVAGSIAGLIGYSVMTYHRESINTEMQYEIQTNLNQIMDTVMASSGAVVAADYAGFGKFNETRDPSGSVTEVVFDGTVFVADSGELYMVKGTSSAQDTAELAVAEVAGTVTGAPDRKPYLMSRNLKDFKITINTDTLNSSCIVSPNEYINPISVDVELEFEKRANGVDISKKVKDNAVIRNRVTSDIYINGAPYKLKR